MKKILLPTIASLVLLSSCNQGKIESLELELEHLKTEKHVADSLQDNFFQTLNDIEKNIGEVKAKQKQLSETKTEKNLNQKDKILQDISEINEIIEQNKRRLAQLESLKRQLNAVNEKTAMYEKLIEEQKQKIAENEAEITLLKEQLNIANVKIEGLTTENAEVKKDNEEKQKVITNQDIALNTGYYAIGTNSELKEKGVVKTTGGFIGIGRTVVVNSEADKSNLKKIDIREVKEIETFSAKVSLVSTHTATAFKWDQTDPKNLKLQITDVNEFWRQSKILVISIK